MRTTLEIDDDLMFEAKETSRIRNQSIGRTVSDWIRQGLKARESPVIEMRNGIPVIVRAADAIPVTSEMVRALADDE